MKTFFLLIIPVFCNHQLERPYWSYKLDEKTGPEVWQSLNRSWNCDGMYQSPVAITASDTILVPWMPEVQFTNYDRPFEITIGNNGHRTVEVDFSSASPPPTIFGSGLEEPYELAQIHVHWGSNDNEGAEHIVGNKQFPCEIHLVHIKKSYERNKKKAMDDPHGLAVLAVFCEIANSSVVPPNGFQEIFVDNSAELGALGSTVQVHNVAANVFLPRGTTNFFRYSGSLTTPSCNEVVVWTVFTETVKVHSKDMAKFREAFNSSKLNSEDRIDRNFRPTQPINGRKVFYRRALTPSGLMDVVLTSSAAEVRRKLPFNFVTVVFVTLIFGVAYL